MYQTDSLTNHKDYQQFINMNTQEGIDKAKVECDKLVYLMGYPDFVTGKIESLKAEIRALYYELQLEVNSSPSPFSKITKRQALQSRYQELTDKNSALIGLRDELVYSKEIKEVAEIKLKVYQTLLNRQGEEVDGYGFGS